MKSKTKHRKAEQHIVPKPDGHQVRYLPGTAQYVPNRGTRCTPRSALYTKGGVFLGSRVLVAPQLCDLLSVACGKTIQKSLNSNRMMALFMYIVDILIFKTEVGD